MVNFRIDIVIDPSKAVTGARKVRSELDRNTNAADRLRNTIRNTFVGLGVGLIVRELGQVADAYTNVQNRVRTVTEGQEELDAVTRQLFQIANDTRTAFDATTEVYSRTALAAQQLGVSQEQTLEFTKSLNQAVVLSGAAADEARAGLIQLSQGLASGALRGDELRSVLEQLPVVADVIAKSLGVTRGELREMGAEGKITAQIILDAFEGAREELDERFGKAVPTISQSFTVLRNNVVEYVGELDQAVGVSALFSTGMIAIAENVDVVAGGVIAIGAGIAVSYIPATVTAASVTNVLTASVVRLNVALAANPFGIAVAAIIAAGVAVNKLTDEYVELERASLAAVEAGENFALTDFGRVGADIIRTQENLARVNEQIRVDQEQGNEVNEAAIRLAERYQAQLSELTARQEALANGTALSADEARKQRLAIEATQKSVDSAIASIEEENRLLQLNSRERGIQAELLKEIDRIERTRGEGSVTDAQRAELEAALRTNEELARRADILERIRGPQQDFESDLASLNTLLQQGSITQQEFTAELTRLAGQLEGVDVEGILAGLDIEGLGDVDLEGFEALLAQLREATALQATTVGNVVSELEQENELLKLNSQEREIQAALLQQVAALRAAGQTVTADDEQRIEDLLRENQALAFQAEVLASITGPQDRLAQTQEALNVLLEDGRITAEQYAAALERVSQAADTANTAQSGLSSGIDQGIKQITDVRGAAEDLAVNGFGAAEDALVSFARTGELDITRLVDSILDDLARLAIRQALLALIGGPSAAGAGAGFGGSFAGGGEFTGGQPILVGEEGPEIITPRGSGEVIPAGETAARMASAGRHEVNVAPPQVTVPITNIVQGSIGDDLATPEGEEGVLNVIRRNPDTVRQS